MERIKIINFNGGGTLIYKNSKRNKATSVLVGFRVGTHNNTQNGIAHFSEHMLFKGTEKRSKTQLEKDLREICGDGYNAFTGQDYTMFQFNRVNSLLDDAFELVSDIWLNSSVTKKFVDSERGVILEEYNSHVDAQKYSVALDHYNIVCKNEISAKTSIGDKEDLEKITAKSIIEFRKKFYTRENFIISVVGSESLCKIKRLVNKYFLKKMPAGDATKMIENRFEFKNESAYAIRKKETDNVLVEICLRCAGLDDEVRAPALRIISSYLTVGTDGLLFKAVRDKGLVYTINTYADMRIEGGIFGITFDSSKDNVNKVIDEIGKVISEVRKAGIPEEDVSKIKKNFSYTDAEADIMNMKSAYANLEKYVSKNPYLKGGFVKKVLATPKEVVDECFADLFDAGNTIYVTIGGKVKQSEVYTMEEIKSRLLK